MALTPFISSLPIFLLCLKKDDVSKLITAEFTLENLEKDLFFYEAIVSKRSFRTLGTISDEVAENRQKVNRKLHLKAENSKDIG